VTRIARIAALGLLLALAACDAPTQTYQGWVEANLIFVSPDEAGRVEKLSVREGSTVEAATPLFELDDSLQRADVNLNAATLKMAQQTFSRAQQLMSTGSGTQRDFDAAQSDLRVAEARLNSSQTRLERRRMASPVSGAVQQVYYRPGEMVPAGRAVVSLLPPGNFKVRFYVPESVLPRIAFGDEVSVRCDNCAPDLVARISFISRTAEYTPPVIYSLEERSKLVFLVEALPTQPEKLRLGQPIDVILASEAKK
jgi:HlyD family secretion protein